jgi:hypothetical protein
MPIQNRSMARAAKKRVIDQHIDLTAASYQSCGFVDPENPWRILLIDVIYDVATDGNAQTENVTVGIPGTLTKYLNYTPAISQAQGTVVSIVPASAAFLAANTPLIICKSAAAGSTNTGEVTINVWYEVLDRSPKP